MSHLFQQIMHQLNLIQNSLNLMHNTVSLKYTLTNMMNTFCLDSQTDLDDGIYMPLFAVREAFQ